MDLENTSVLSGHSSLAIPTRVSPGTEEEACLNGEARYGGRFFRINLSNEQQRAAYVELGGENDIGLHTHSYYELVYIYDGHPVNEINGKSYACAPGNIFLMNTRLTHRLAGDNYFAVSVTLSREDILTAMQYSHRRDTRKPFSPEESPVLRFMQFNAPDGKYSALEHSHLLFSPTPASLRGTFPDYLKSCFDRYAVTIVELAPGWRFELWRLLSVIFSLLQDPSLFECEDVTETPSKNRKLYYDVLRLMEQTQGNITRSDLSARLFYSENHIANVVREHCGLTIQQLKRTFVMERARRLLRDSSSSIEEIAEQVGFSTKSSFYHSFKDYFGCTPLSYRESRNAPRLPSL